MVKIFNFCYNKIKRRDCMLDIKKVGIKICMFRKKIGYSQEKLAEILCISPQAISRWENGHTLHTTK